VDQRAYLVPSGPRARGIALLRRSWCRGQELARAQEPVSRGCRPECTRSANKRVRHRLSVSRVVGSQRTHPPALPQSYP
jgi:hypothetical protein